MSNKKNTKATNQIENHKSFRAVVGVVICAIVCVSLSYKLVMAVAAALGWFSFYAVTHFDPVELVQAGIFGIAWSFWAFKRPTVLKAMKWQSSVCIAEWIPLCVIAFALNGSGPRMDFVVYMFLINLSLGMLSGFLTGWMMPHVLAWSQNSSPPVPPSFSQAPHDTTYKIEG